MSQTEFDLTGLASVSVSRAVASRVNEVHRVKTDNEIRNAYIFRIHSLLIYIPL